MFEFCPKCSAARVGDMRYCGRCGFDLASGGAATPIPSSREPWGIAQYALGALAVALVVAIAAIAFVGLGPKSGPSGAAGGSSASPSPTGATGDQATKWAEYLLHVERASRESTPLFSQLQSAVQAWGPGTPQHEARLEEIRKWARWEVEWLQTHPPAMCYASAHAALKKAFEALVNITTSTPEMQAATLLMGDAQMAMQKTSCPKG